MIETVIALLMIVNNEIKEHRIQESMSECLKGKRVASIPARAKGNDAMIMRQCTSEYKIKPVNETIRKLHNLKPKQRMKPTELWLGISTDEIQRMKESIMYNINYFYPLIYHNMSRAECMNFFKENNFPVPVKSSCVFCPFHSDKFWRSLKKENGSAWKMSVEVDKIIRDHPKLKEKQYLHKSCEPLSEINFQDNQTDLFEEECEGYCGI